MTVSLEQLRRCHIAVDLGAARTRVYVKGVGLVVDEPSVAAVNMRTGSLIAVGALAEQMTGRTPAYIRVARPVSGGTVVDIDMAQRMLRHLLGEKLRRQLRRKPRLRAAACTPHDADPLAQRATVETLVGLGARRVELVDTLIAAALGCGLPVEQPTATMIMVCGAATTQIAVLSLGSIVTAVRVPIGGEAIDNAVIQHLRQHHQLVLPSQSVRPCNWRSGATASPSTVRRRRRSTGGTWSPAWPVRSRSTPPPCARRSTHRSPPCSTGWARCCATARPTWWPTSRSPGS